MKTAHPPSPWSAALPEAVGWAADAAWEKHAEAIVVLDLRGMGAFTDFFLICSAGSGRQISAVRDAVEEHLERRRIRAAHREGRGTEEWVLLDYGRFVVHIFSQRARLYYDLERLWRAARRHEFAGTGVASREKKTADE